MAWKIGVEAPEEMADNELSVLDGNGENGEEDSASELRWPLADPLGVVVVQWSDELDAVCRRSFEASEYRIFKVAATGDKGRAVSRPTHGHYIVIAPRALVRVEAGSTAPPIAPEAVIPEAADLLAHHLLGDADSAGLVLAGEGHPTVEIRPTSAARYELVGHRIEDALDTAGPLFGREPPRLRVRECAEPAQVVVGVEGAALRGRPRAAAASFDALASWFDEHQPEWFFVRLYDGNGDLLESLDFRYAQGLHGIDIDEYSPLPTPSRHRPAKVRFHLASGLRVTVIDGPQEITSRGSVRTEGFELPAHPDGGQAVFAIRAARGAELKVVVRVPRIWWALTSEGDRYNTPNWKDTRTCLAFKL